MRFVSQGHSLRLSARSLQIIQTYGLSQALMRVGWRRPEINPEINPEIPSKVDNPRKASPSQVYQIKLSQIVVGKLTASADHVTYETPPTGGEAEARH